MALMADTKSDSHVVLVTGLPRSGTSMLMRMLAAGGLRLYVDEQRRPDEDNPLGYFEHEVVKRSATDPHWFSAAAGKVVKVVAPLIRYLPAQPPSDAILIERDLGEVIASQRKMLDRAGKTGAALAEDRLRDVLGKQVLQAKAHLRSRPDTRLLVLGHREVIQAPTAAAEQIHAFLGRQLACADMAAAVDPALYRNRG